MDKKNSVKILQDQAFIETVNHELKSPLTTMKIYTEIMQKNAASNPEFGIFNDNLQKLNNKIDYLTSLINDYTDLVKNYLNKLPYSFTTIDFDKLLADFAENYNRRFAPGLIYLSGSTGKTVRGDSSRLNQAFSSLVWYAKKKMPDGEKICFDVSSTGNELTVSISDSSIGDGLDNFMADSNQKKDLSIGPALALEIIRQHGGRLNVYQSGSLNLINFILPAKS